MNQANKQTTTSSADGSIASRTRGQPRIRGRDDELEEKQQPAQSSSHVSPAMRVYRHALESIFAMLQLHDLSRVLAVSQSWSAAGRSMKPIGARIADQYDYRLPEKPLRTLPPIETLISSPLLRHVSAIEFGKDNGAVMALTRESLALLAQRAPNLTSLYCQLTRTPGAPLILPAKLTSLQLSLLDKPSAAELNAVLMALSALPYLSRLKLTPPSVAELDFQLLARSSALIDFELNTFVLELTEVQVKQIRSTLGHLQRIAFTLLDSHTLAQLLQPPVDVRWQDIGMIYATAQTGDLLLTLPTLTALRLIFTNDAPHADFLSQLPLLRSLTLWSSNWSSLYIRADAALGSLLACSGLTELNVECGFNSAQFSTLFAKLTKLRQLKIHGGLESLQCFASGPATQSLEELELHMPLETLPPSEVSHLYALKRLRKLKLFRCFPSRLDAATIDSISPRSSLPMLTDVDLCWVHVRQWDVEKRSGPSFAATNAVTRN